jgi:ABC-type multidrug transport system fused ATPase/permease subunit
VSIETVTVQRAEEPTQPPGLAGLLGRRWKPLTIIGIVAGGAAFAEAMILILITRLAFAISEGDDTVSVVAGRSVSIRDAFILSLLFVFVTISLQVTAAWRASQLTALVIADTRLDLADAFLDAKWSEQHGERTGQLQELLTTFIRGGAQLISAVSTGTTSAVSLIALLVAAAFVDPIAAALLFALIVGLALAVRPLNRLVDKEAERTAAAGMDFATSLSEVAQLGLEMHIFNVQPSAKSRLGALIRRNQVTNQRLDFWYQFIPTTYATMSYLALIAALVGIWMVGDADLSAIGAVTLLMFRAIRYGQGVQLKLTEVKANLPFLRQLDRELARYRAARELDGGRSIGKVGELRVDGVSFEYRDGLAVLRNIDAAIAPCEVIGLIGPSGSGKSTLVQLLLGLREPTTGSVLANGRDIHSLSKTEWARKVTFVPQEAHLVAGTVADNIRFFRDDITQEQIEHAARLANLHDDVAHWPEGYDRQVGENGSHLSGGQQQRLIIARALVEEPDVFILDEPTSSLDVRSEQLIRTTLDGLRHRMTIVIIAHRLSTLDICDRIMVLIDGELKAFDTPERLEESNDFYREALVISGMR